MKSLKFVVILIGFFILNACSSDDEVVSSVDVPSQFSIDIPSSLSSNTGNLSGRLSGDGDGIIEGDEIYESLRYFIYLGEESAEILELTLTIGAILEASNIRSYTFVGDDDAREKRIDIVEGVTRGGVSYEYEMTMVDTENEQQALQLLWNTNPVSGIGILNPYNIDRTDSDVSEGTYLRIDYSEDDPAYDATMTISISGLDPVENGDIDNMRMFVGKKDNLIDVMGNSNHPNVVIIDESFTGGRNYAFVGRGDETSDLGVVKLALPPSSTTTADVLDTYSVFNVLDEEINAVANLDQGVIDAILVEAQSPAYFNSGGFITSGTANQPDDFSNAFVDLSGMNPFIPNDIRTLAIDFIQ